MFHFKRLGLLIISIIVIFFVAGGVGYTSKYLFDNPKSENSKQLIKTVAAYLPQILTFYFLTFGCNILFLKYDLGLAEDFYNSESCRSDSSETGRREDKRVSGLKNLENRRNSEDDYGERLDSDAGRLQTDH
jgi:hypothetical protein